MIRALFLFLLATGLIPAAPMSYTLSGTGSGYWNSQPFSNATFTFTFNSDTSTIVHGTSCCGATDSTPSGTLATISVAGFPAAQLSGDQAIFMDHSNATAGIWHFNAAQFMTVTNTVFEGDDLTTTIPPNSVSGTTWAYATPFPLSSGGTLYFTSVQNVYYSQQPTSGGQPYTTSVTPSSGSQLVNTTQTYTFVVGDSAGVSDLAGVDIQFRDKPTIPSACWLFFNPISNTVTMNDQGNWGPPTPIGSGGSTLTGDACTVNTAAITASASGNNLTLVIPIEITTGDNNTWQIFADAQNKENVDAGYIQLGTVTAESSQGSQGYFTVSVSPGSQYAAAGSSVNYTVTVTGQGGFNEPLTFNGASSPTQGGTNNTTQLTITFNPATLPGPGATTMTVTSPSDATPTEYTATVTAVSQTYAQSANGYLIVENAAPQLTLSPTSGAGSSATFTITWPDTANNPTQINVLIAPSLNGQNACWLFLDTTSRGLYLASNDGSSWTEAYQLQNVPQPYGNPTTGSGASNSQCTFSSTPTWDGDSGYVTGVHSGHNTLTLPLTFFTPAFDGTKTVYTRAANAAGFDTGYQPMGGWTVQ